MDEHEIEHDDPTQIHETSDLPTEVDVPEEIEEGLRREKGERDIVDDHDEA